MPIDGQNSWVSSASVQRIWSARGLKPHLVKTFKISNDRVPGAVTLGWVADMAGLMAAADVLVENAGGLTSKEAFRVGLPVVTFRPSAGHGRHDADALTRLELLAV